MPDKHRGKHSFKCQQLNPETYRKDYIHHDQVKFIPRMQGRFRMQSWFNIQTNQYNSTLTE